MMRRRLAAGELLFEEGDPSDAVVLVTTGSVDVVRAAGDDEVLLGTAGAGEFVGEMGVLEARPRSATVRAATDLEFELIERGEFLDRVSHEPSLAHKILLRMSTRLRDVEDVLARLHRPEADTADAQSVEGLPTIALSATTFGAKFYVGTQPIQITTLPFALGRSRTASDTGPGVAADLEIPEPEPYRLSPRHFSLMAEDDRILVHDLGSELGTIVNGVPLGRDFSVDSAALQPGENSVVAGGQGSPFAFKITLG